MTSTQQKKTLIIGGSALAACILLYTLFGRAHTPSKEEIQAAQDLEDRIVGFQTPGAPLPDICKELNEKVEKTLGDLQVSFNKLAQRQKSAQRELNPFLEKALTSPSANEEAKQKLASLNAELNSLKQAVEANYARFNAQRQEAIKSWEALKNSPQYREQSKKISKRLDSAYNEQKALYDEAEKSEGFCREQGKGYVGLKDKYHSVMG